MSARVFDYEGEACILSVTRDITKRNERIKEIEYLHQELLSAYDDTLAGWSRALSLRDAETSLHSERVVMGAVALAKGLGYPENELVHLRWGAILHDIGKMGVPDHILLKPGALTIEERKIMQKHPAWAYQMLQEIPFLEKAWSIPYCHHERWDGTGYPQGLKGTGIPLSARIFSLIDVLDALLSNRPYRKAWTRDKVLAFIKENSGSHFDPDIVDYFLEHEGEVYRF